MLVVNEHHSSSTSSLVSKRFLVKCCFATFHLYKSWFPDLVNKNTVEMIFLLEIIWQNFRGGNCIFDSGVRQWIYFLWLATIESKKAPPLPKTTRGLSTWFRLRATISILNTQRAYNFQSKSQVFPQNRLYGRLADVWDQNCELISYQTVTFANFIIDFHQQSVIK